MTLKPNSRNPTPLAQLRSFLARFDPKSQKLIRSVRAALQKRFPTANELAYDYNHSIVISYSPTDHGIDGIVAISASAKGIFLYFNQGQNLPDPTKLLQGSGKQTRFVRVDAADQLAQPDMEALMDASMDQAKVPLPTKGRGILLIRGAASKESPRRPRT